MKTATMKGRDLNTRKKQTKRKRKSKARRAGKGQTLVTDKPDPSDRSGEQSEKSGPAPNEHLEKTLKALQDKVDSLEKQLQNKRHWTF